MVVRTLVAAIIAVAGTTACGPDLSSVVPVGPDTLAPLLGGEGQQPQSAASVAQVWGVWSGPLSLNGIIGGTGIVSDAGAIECVGEAFQAREGGDNTSSLVIDQTGAALTARLTSAVTGLAGTYAGASSSTLIVLDAASWDADELVIRCFDGNVRRMRLVGSSIIAPVAEREPTMLSGSIAHTYNIFSSDNIPVGGLVARYTFTVQKR